MSEELTGALPGGGRRVNVELWLNVTLAALVVGILAVGGLFGYQVYQDRQRAELANASTRVIKALESQIRKAPNDATLRVRLGEALGAAGKYKDAIRQLNAALKIEPEHTGAYLDLGVIAMMTERNSKAMTYFQKVIDISGKQGYTNVNQRRELAFYNMGQIALEQKHYEDAAGYFKEALRIRKDASDSYFYLARAYEGMGELDGALKNLEIAVAFDPGFAEAHYFMGEIYLKQDDKINASVHLAKAVELAPDADPPREALESLGTAQEWEAKAREAFEARNLTEAVENVLVARNLDPTNTKLMKLHAQILIAKGNRKGALSAYQDVLKIDPKDAEAKAQVAKLKPKTRVKS